MDEGLEDENGEVHGTLFSSITAPARVQLVHGALVSGVCHGRKDTTGCGGCTGTARTKGAGKGAEGEGPRGAVAWCCSACGGGLRAAGAGCMQAAGDVQQRHGLRHCVVAAGCARECAAPGVHLPR